MQALNFHGKFRTFRNISVQQLAGCLIRLSDLHNIDTVGGCWRNLDKRSTNVVTGPGEFMPFIWGNDKYLDIFPSHTKCHKLHGEGFAGAGRPENNHIGIFIDRRIEISTRTRELFALFTPIKMPSLSDIS